jgi:hypothetical protein
LSLSGGGGNSVSWDKSTIKVEKYLLPFDIATEKHPVKKLRAEVDNSSNGGGGAAASSSLSSLPLSPSLSRSTSSQVIATKVGPWSVRTFHLIQPLNVEAIVTMK